MNYGIATGTEAVTVLSTVLFDAAANSGIDILVIQDPDPEGVIGVASSLGVEMREVFQVPRFDAGGLPDLLLGLFLDEGEGGDPGTERDDDALFDFVRRIAFTR